MSRLALVRSTALTAVTAAGLALGAVAEAGPAPGRVASDAARIEVPDVALVTQDAETVRLRSQVIGERIAVVNFVYTSCRTSCAIQTAIMAAVQAALGSRAGADVTLVTITVDPKVDVPPRLEAYATKHGATAGWTWLTGDPERVTTAVKAFGAYTRDPAQHPPVILVGDARSGSWARFYGVTSPDAVVRKVAELQAQRHSREPWTTLPGDASVQREYFTDLEVLTQHGKPVRFYTDVLRDRVVVVNFLFTGCTGACPLLTAKLARVHEIVGRGGGARLRLVSITVDPERDTPGVLAEYAARFGAGPGWLFLTGSKANVQRISRRLGESAPTPDGHTSGLLVGDLGRGRWLRVRPDVSAEELAALLRRLLDA